MANPTQPVPGHGVADPRDHDETAVGSDLDLASSRTVILPRGPSGTIPRPVPNRYLCKDDQDGPYLTCTETSNIRIRIDRTLSISPSAARKSNRGTMYLDGAAQGEPFADASRRVYNLDHHEGCVRAFTLATCEQAMVVILKGLDLSGNRWTVLAGDPDLDTVLAVWLLLNHRRLAGSRGLRRRVMPLVRLEGAIDAHGLDLAELTGFPDELQRAMLATIDALRSRELDHKRGGTWDEIDLLEFTAASLHQIDGLFFTPEELEGCSGIEELSRAWIGANRLAIACRSELGIYEVEELLKEMHGDRLGLIVLAKSDDSYTLRQTDPFMGATLDSVYRRLNFLDRRAAGDQRWGGSDDIGGSPRAEGTGLSVDEIMAAARWVYDPPSLGRRALATAAATSTAAVVLAASALAARGARFRSFVSPETGTLATAGLTLLGITSLLLLLGRTRLAAEFGLRSPRSWRPLALLPVTAAAALAGGVWAPMQLALTDVTGGSGGWTMLLAIAAGVVGFELLVRGVCHGLLATVHPVMLWTGRFFVSFPNAGAAVLSTTAVTALLLPPVWLGGGVWITVVWVASTLIASLVLGVAQERAASVWVPVGLHLAAVAVAWFLLPMLLRP